MKHLTWALSPNGSGIYLHRMGGFTALDIIGVYVIYQPLSLLGGHPYLYVGQGYGLGGVGARLTAHARDPRISQYRKRGPIYVTWAVAPAFNLDGIERYLADTLQPLEGERHPNAWPIPVNLPIAA